ncbi:hypothetical protein ACFPOG_30780 [Paenibacillus aestuarii]|uniref:MarR family transcriptional regulator n=1 Tax=Paenibacillus aestuarii TaxID=516965 RepID=A0ABW0KGL0_9BACL
MDTKRCLFCNKIVSVEVKGNDEVYFGCCCAPDSCYSLTRESYLSFFSLSLENQRDMFPIISGYIRDLTECGERVALSYDDLEAIKNSARIPVMIDEKENLLLRYFHKRCIGPHEPVQIRPLSENFNLTYSPNLQEFVYVIEQLRDKKLIERTGTTFELTKYGWEEAAARIGKKKLEPCIVLLPNDSLHQKWRELVFPIIEKFGFFARFVEMSNLDDSIGLISECKLLIADITGDTSEGYFASGLALGLGITVICTKQHSHREALPPLTNQLKPILWGELEELTFALRNRLKSRTSSSYQVIN